MEGKNTVAWLSALFVLVGIGILGFLFYYHPNESNPTFSSVVLSPTPELSGTQTLADPEVTTWKPYENQDYLFQINVPDGWYTQDYKDNFQHGGTLIAFSPTTLPCSTCTYVHDGFLSIKIYNASTDATSYANFQTKFKNVGKDPQTLGVYVDQKVGVMIGNTVDVENQGWVYEFSYDVNNGEAKPFDSKLFQQILSSFRFTGLQFK